MAYKSKFTGKQVEERLEHMLNVTYDELKMMRDSSQLIPGHMYRMTDYETTCTWLNTQIALHPFDLVLTALDNKTLDEKCSAIWSERDTDGYFSNSNLPAWDVRYCMDNNKNRFDWAQQGGKVCRFYIAEFEEYFTTGTFWGEYSVGGEMYFIWDACYEGEPDGFYVCSKTMDLSVGDTLYLWFEEDEISQDFTGEIIDIHDVTDGKGVIYRLIDECNNDCPYDFKNIMFVRPLTEGVLDGYNGIETLCYTFSCIQDDFTIEDQSVKEPYYCCNNKFASYCVDNVFLMWYGDNCSSNTFGNGCSSNTFGSNCYSNTFGDNCCNNSFGDHCQNNSFGSECYYNTLGINCVSNIFKFYCEYNSFGNSCNNNILRDYCNSNTLGNSCSSNTFGNSCSSNTFGNSCSSNTFGNSCRSNTLGKDSSDNVFGNDCSNNTLVGWCTYITFSSLNTKNTLGQATQSCYFGLGSSNNILGSQCHLTHFGNYCERNNIGSSSKGNRFNLYCSDNNIGENCNYNVFDDNCIYNTLANNCSSNTFQKYCSYNNLGVSGSGFYAQNITFGDDCSYINFTSDSSGSMSAYIEYYSIFNVSGKSSSQKTEIVAIRERTYQTFVTTKSDGTVIEYTIDNILNAQSNTPV